MTNFTIDGIEVNGLNNAPFLSMNLIPKKERTPEELAMIESYKTLSLMNALDDKAALSGLNRQELQDLFDGIDVIKGAATTKTIALMNRVNGTL